MPRPDLEIVARAFSEEMGRRKLNEADLVRRTGLSPGTVRTAVKGERWPLASKRGMLEEALGWDYGWMQKLRDGDGLVTLQILREQRGDVLPRRRDPGVVLLAFATREELEDELRKRGG